MDMRSGLIRVFSAVALCVLAIAFVPNQFGSAAQGDKGPSTDQAAADNSKSNGAETSESGAKPAKAPPGFFAIVFSGGPVGIGIMLVLIALSIITVYLIVDHPLTVRKKDLIPPGLDEHVRSCLLAGKVDEAEKACRDSPSLLSFVLVQGISEVEFGWASVEKTLEDSLAEQSARLFRKIEYLAVIGNIAPMVGLLGTVVGMVLAFRQVAISEGSAGAGELAEGIYMALVTTVAGLLIAIPALGAFAIYRNRLDQMVAEAAYIAQHVFTPLRKKRSK